MAGSTERETAAAAEWQQQVESLLEQLALSGTTARYAVVATEAGIPPPFRIHQLTGYLEQLTAADIKAGRPLRAAVVIGHRGIPGEGFFDFCQANGLHPLAGEGRTAWHQRLLRQLAKAKASQSNS